MFTGFLLLVSVFLISGEGTNIQVRPGANLTEQLVTPSFRKVSKTIAFTHTIISRVSQVSFIFPAEISLYHNSLVKVKIRELQRKFIQIKPSVIQKYLSYCQYTKEDIFSTELA